MRSVATVTPEWDDEQRELALAWLDWEADRGPHGYSMREATSPEADPANRAGRISFKADPVPIRDHAEYAKAVAKRAYEEQYPNANMAGLIFPVRRIEREPGSTPKRRTHHTDDPGQHTSPEDDAPEDHESPRLSEGTEHDQGESDDNEDH